MSQVSTPDVRVLNSSDEVARAAADIFTDLANQALKAGHPFTVALSGGSTPKLLYRLLSSGEYKNRVPWGSIKFFFGDERWVPHTHPDSNYKLAKDELFDKVPVDPAQIFPIPTEHISPEDAADQYSKTLVREFNLMGEKGMPRFDLIFLGMGDDGHTASCFPHTGALHANETLVDANFVPKFGTYRITLTPPVLQAGREVVFMVAGDSKAPALQEVLKGAYNPEMYPSQLLRHGQGHVIWLVDTAAASQLKDGGTGQVRTEH